MLPAHKKRRIEKVCGYCGKQEGNHWSRHFKNKHPLRPILELDGLYLLIKKPWCENWQKVITENAKPVNVRTKFKSDGIPTHISKVKAVKLKQTKCKAQFITNTQNHEELKQDARQQARQNCGNLSQKRALNLSGSKQINKKNGINLKKKQKSRKVDSLESQPLLHEGDKLIKYNGIQHQNIKSVDRNAEEVPVCTLSEVIAGLIEEHQNNIQITTSPAIVQQFPEIAVIGPQKVNLNVWDSCFNDFQYVYYINIGYLNTPIASDSQQIPAKSTQNLEFSDQLDNLPQIMPVKPTQNDSNDKLILLLLGQTNYTFDKIMTWDFANKTIDSYLQIRFDMRQITLEELGQSGNNYKYEFAQSNLTPQCKIFANDLLLVSFKDVSTLDHQQIALNLCKAVLPRQDILKAFTQELGKYLFFKKIQLLITNDATIQSDLLSLLNELVVSTKTEPQLVSQFIFEDQIRNILNKSAPTKDKKQQIQLQQLQDMLDLQDNKLKELQGKLIVAIEDSSFNKHRYGMQMQIDTNKRSFKELCPNESSSEFNVSSMHSSQVVNLYKDNIFPNADAFQEGCITADDEKVSKYKQQAYEDKILIRTNQRWENKMHKFKQTQYNLEQLVKQKTKQIAELEFLLTSRLNELQFKMQSQIDQQNQTIKDQHTQLEQLRTGKINPSIACSVTEASTNVVPFVIDAEQQLFHMGYSHVQLIGQGGFGIVFKVCKDQKLFAIKIPIRLDCKNEIILMKKIQSTGYLNRQFVVLILDEILILKRPSFVMNYYEKTLEDFIQENHSIDQIKLIFYFILRGVSAAHTYDPLITHRDIKPANILFNSLMCPLIADWGLASQDAHKFTGGTCSYMDPRIWHQAKSTPQNPMQSHYGIKPLKQRIDYKSADVWSLGIVLYQMVEKHHPFNKDQLESWRNSQIDTNVPLAFAVADGQLQVFIASMLQLNQQKRPTVCQLLLSSVVTGVTSGIRKFDDPIDLRSFFPTIDVDESALQKHAQPDQKQEVQTIQEETNPSLPTTSVFSDSVSTLRHPSHLWLQQELNVECILNAVNEVSLLKFFEQNKKASAPIKDIWSYLSRLFTGEVLSFVKVSEFIERIKSASSLKLKLLEYSSYNRDQSLLSLRHESTNTHLKKPLSPDNNDHAVVDSSLGSDLSNSINYLASIDSSDFSNIRRETLAELAQMQGIAAERAAKYIQTIGNNELNNVISDKDSIVNDFEDRKHVGVGLSIPSSSIVVDQSLQSEDTIFEPHENADSSSQSHISVVVGRNLCITKNKARVVGTPTIIGKRRERKHKQDLDATTPDEKHPGQSRSSISTKKHGRQQLGSYTCKLCEKDFANPKKLAKHKYIVHGKGRDLNAKYNKVLYAQQQSKIIL